jgi:hypothetical protein
LIRRINVLRIEPSGRLAFLAAEAGAGVAYVIERWMAEDLAAGLLVRALEDWTPPFAGVALYYPKQRLPSAGLAAFIEHFRAWWRGGQARAFSQPFPPSLARSPMLIVEIAYPIVIYKENRDAIAPGRCPDHRLVGGRHARQFPASSNSEADP